MANTLTDLIPDLYASLNVISRELVGFIPSVTMDPTTSRAAIGQTVRSPVAPSADAADIVPGVTAPDNGDQVISNVELSITKSRAVPFRWNGEQELGLSSGVTASAIRQQQMQQAMRTLVNEMESDLAGQHMYASRAYGAATTTPFGTAGDFRDASNVLKILKDNGAPQTDNSLVIDTSAGVNLLGLQSRYDIAGDTQMQNQGVIVNKAGFAIRESAQVKTSTAGTADSATTDTTGYAVGATEITLAAVGTGTLVTGDVITFAGDTNKYVVKVGAGAVSGAEITIAAPGLRQAIPASATAITVVAAAARNMAFNRSSIVLAQRLPALPDGGDMAVDRMTITDPRSGISFEVSMYAQYRQMRYEIAAAWGVKTVNPEHVAVLLG